MQSVITRSRLVEGNYLKEILKGKQKMYINDSFLTAYVNAIHPLNTIDLNCVVENKLLPPTRQ